jgi:hypothetical protein
VEVKEPKCVLVLVENALKETIRLALAFVQVYADSHGFADVGEEIV